jgi:tetrapyrrole methylase family protein/MazG family protein
MKTTAACEAKFRELLTIIAKLRGADGCPWDRAQTKPDIGRYLIEEAYEVLEALEGSSPEHVQEELGDLLFQILFLARMAEEAGEFNITDVLGEISAKMVRRHPHVFGGATVEGVEEVRTNWERIKTEVEHKEQKNPALCDGIPRSLSTLAKSKRNWPNFAPRWKRKTRNGYRTRRGTCCSRWSTSAVLPGWMRKRRSVLRCGNSLTAFPI